MEPFKIDTEIEKQVEAMFSLAQQIRDLKKAYPSCWSIISEQFNLGGYRGSSFTENSAETIKVDLYVEIFKKNEIEKLTKQKSITKKL